MKEKGKKILKGLGVGALACLGMFTFAGCSMDLTEEQMEKIMYTVDQSDQFMEDMLQLLQNQNREFNKQQVYEKVKLAESKLLTNNENVQDNLKISVRHSFPEFGDLCYDYYYYRQDDVRIYLGKEDNDVGTGKNIDLLYSSADKTYHYIRREGYTGYESDYNTEEKSLIDEYFDYYLMKEGFCYSLFGLSLMDMDQTNICDCEIDSNGNFTISSVIEVKEEDEEDPENFWTVQRKVIEVVLTSEGLIKSITINEVCIDANDHPYFGLTGNIGETSKLEINYEYGNITDDMINTELNRAKNFSIE